MNGIKFLTILLINISLTAFSQKKIDINDVVSKRIFTQKTIPGLHSMNDGLNYTVVEDGTKIVKYSYKTGNKVDVVFDLSKIENAGFKSITDYVFSSDETKILFMTNRKPLYRHSFTADYFVWNSSTKEMSPLSKIGRASCRERV